MRKRAFGPLKPFDILTPDEDYRHRWFSRGYNQYISPLSMKGNILGSGMAHCNSSISPLSLLEKDIGYGFTHNVTSADYYHLCPFSLNPRPH